MAQRIPRDARRARCPCLIYGGRDKVHSQHDARQKSGLSALKSCLRQIIARARFAQDSVRDGNARARARVSLFPFFLSSVNRDIRVIIIIMSGPTSRKRTNISRKALLRFASLQFRHLAFVFQLLYRRHSPRAHRSARFSDNARFCPTLCETRASISEQYGISKAGRIALSPVIIVR